MTNKCACGEEYDQISLHWNANPKHRPDVSNKQHEIITGLLMGDGYVPTFNTVPAIACQMINKSYIAYLSEKFPKLTLHTKVVKETSGGNKVFQWRSVAHPEFQEYSDWYSSGERVWPENIKLTPTVLKHWYCGDGTYNVVGNTGRVVISMRNELGNEEKVENYFREANLPTPNNWITSKNPHGLSHKAIWNVEESKELLKYMGEPLPSFKYKWLIENNDN